MQTILLGNTPAADAEAFAIIAEQVRVACGYAMAEARKRMAADPDSLHARRVAIATRREVGRVLSAVHHGDK